MLRRKVVALCLILIFALGTGSAFAAKVDEPRPSDELAKLVKDVNHAIHQAVVAAQEDARVVVKDYTKDRLDEEQALAALNALAEELQALDDALISSVIDMAEAEGITWDCVYETVILGKENVLFVSVEVDPIYVPGNSD
jgi:hypothetical protein